jgi:hypothetical protein
MNLERIFENVLEESRSDYGIASWEEVFRWGFDFLKDLNLKNQKISKREFRTALQNEWGQLNGSKIKMVVDGLESNWVGETFSD